MNVVALVFFPPQFHGSWSLAEKVASVIGCTVISMENYCDGVDEGNGLDSIDFDTLIKNLEVCILLIFYFTFSKMLVWPFFDGFPWWSLLAPKILYLYFLAFSSSVCFMLYWQNTVSWILILILTSANKIKSIRIKIAADLSC